MAIQSDTLRTQHEHALCLPNPRKKPWDTDGLEKARAVLNLL
jgi:hypothetical protein